MGSDCSPLLHEDVDTKGPLPPPARVVLHQIVEQLDEDMLVPAADVLLCLLAPRPNPSTLHPLAS